MSRKAKRIKRKKRRWRSVVVVLILAIVAVGLGSLFYLNTPCIELVGDDTIQLPLNQSFNDPGIKLEKNKKALPQKDYSVHGKVNTQVPGNYKIDYTVSYFGLKRQVTRNVLVIVDPVEMTLLGSEEQNLYIGREYQEEGVQVSGGGDANIQDKVTISGEVDTQNPGRYELTYKVTDAAGELHEIKRIVNVVKKRIYLTFDDGPSEITTPQFLQILKEENIKATFFVIGGGPDSLIKQAFDEGHTIGLHTYSHDYAKVYSSASNYFEDLSQISQRVQTITGEESKIIRFPGGSSNDISANYSKGIMRVLEKQVKERGYQYFDWNVSSGDGSNQSSFEIPYQNVTTQLKDDVDNVVLMHDTKQTSADALRQIIEYGKTNGFAFERLELDSFPAHHG